MSRFIQDNGFQNESMARNDPIPLAKPRDRNNPSTKSSSSYRFSDQVGYLLRRAYQRHLAIFQSNSIDPQLTAVQFSTLCALQDSGPQSQGELVKATGIDQATIRGIVDRLLARRLIALSKDSKDGRKVIITITGSGSNLLVKMIPCAIKTTEDTLAGLNPAERLALLHTLRQIADMDASGVNSEAPE